MAQVFYKKNIADFDLGGTVYCRQLAVIYEPSTASFVNAGVSAYVALYYQLQGLSGNSGVTGGRLEADPVYGTGETTPQIINAASPFSAAGTIPTAATWFVMRADGKLYTEGTSEPTAATDVHNSRTANLRERLAVDGTKTLTRVNFYSTR